MKKLKFLPVAVILLVLLVSCGTSNPFGEKNPFVYSIEQEGSYVFTTTDKNTVNSFADFGPLEYKRVSGFYNPDSGLFCGAVEGSFSKVAVNTALSVSKLFEKVKEGKFTFYRHKESGLQLYAPANGIILFSNGYVEDLYNQAFVNRSENSHAELATRILSASTGVYVSSPTVLPDLGFDISSEAAERFDYIVILSDSEIYNAEFSMKTEKFADSFLTLIRTAYTTALREKGEKINTSYLKTIMLKKDNSVFLLEQDYDSKLISGILGQI